jgi:hypothetical protein
MTCHRDEGNQQPDPALQPTAAVLAVSGRE